MTIVCPVASASAMMPREMAERTFWISASEKPCAIHQRGAAGDVGIVVQLEIALPRLGGLDHQRQRLAQEGLELALLAELEEAQGQRVLAGESPEITDCREAVGDGIDLPTRFRPASLGLSSGSELRSERTVRPAVLDTVRDVTSRAQSASRAGTTLVTCR